jgi:hypothetical protein
MTRQQIIEMQRRIGATPDGFWGPLSIAACKAHLRRMMPHPNPWPSSDQSSLRAFYGQPGDERNLVMMEFPYRMLYAGQAVSRTRVHARCADSLFRVLSNIRGMFAAAPHIVDEATDFAGVYNYRPKRGGTSWSLHAWGAAIDLDADDNTFRDSWPMKADMPLEIMEAFAREGWKSAGAFWGYDAMHHEAAR